MGIKQFFKNLFAPKQKENKYPEIDEHIKEELVDKINKEFALKEGKPIDEKKTIDAQEVIDEFKD